MLGNALKSIVKTLGGEASRNAAAEALPGAGLNLAMGMLTGGPKAGLAYGAGDFPFCFPHKNSVWIWILKTWHWVFSSFVWPECWA